MCCDYESLEACCCPPQTRAHRAFLTGDEKLARLKDYKESLEKEIVGVEERIKELREGK